MTIVGHSSSFAGRGNFAVCPILAKRLKEFQCPVSNRLLILLEAYLDVTNQTLGLSEMGSWSWTSKWRGFAGALASSRFHSGSGANIFYYTRTFLAELGDYKTVWEWVFPTRARLATNVELRFHYDNFENEDLLKDRVRFWRGWPAKNSKGSLVNWRLYSLHERFGEEFSDKMFDSCVRYIRGRASSCIPGVNEFADYVALYPGKVTSRHFQDPDFLDGFIRQFMVWYFRTGNAKGTRISQLFITWSKFVKFLEEYVIGKIWANTTLAIPKPAIRKTKNATSSLRRTAAGQEVKVKLITHVPLEVTDTQAVDLLWKDIEEEVDTVCAWARVKVDATWNCHTNSKQLATVGIVGTLGSKGTDNGLRARVARSNPRHLEHAAATYASLGVTDEQHHGYEISRLYPLPLNQTTRELGIPTPIVVFAHCTLLVRAHPQITSSFLELLELFDKNGQMTGFYKGDAGWYLKGYKRRKGANKAEQKILLTAETAEIVRRYVELSQPLRTAMRNSNNDKWRRLFLTMNSLGSSPYAHSIRDFSNLRSVIVDDLMQTANLHRSRATNLVKRFTLTRLRSSCGVLIYLKTQSVQKMADELGHEKYKPNLLDRYLPRVLQQHFVERWIRLFQTGIVCESLKDSPLLFKASSFNTMAELNHFLENHAIKVIPPHLQNPDTLNSSHSDSQSSRVVFGISIGLLSIMLSLQSATLQATRPICAMAKRWTAIIDKLIAHLEKDDQYIPLLISARNEVDTTKYRKLIYGD